jgi:5-methylcytosine-specific restriction protein A
VRNPKWHRDEIILALDLYFSTDRGSIDKKNPKIIEVSRVLNELPIFPERPDEEKFRNANGVTLKLSNFLTFDHTYKGKGMSGGSRLDEEVFNEFLNERDRLRHIAAEIRGVAGNAELKHKIYAIEEDEQTLRDTVMEGQVLYKLHKVRERDKKIVDLKKHQSILLTNKLTCEACIFEFAEFYGQLGQGYIECHHRTPLYSIEAAQKTTLDDLALVCANCHRMLHRSKTYITVAELGMMIKYDRV